MNHVRPQYSTWTFSCTILPYCSTAVIISKNVHILRSFNVNEIGSQWVPFLLYFNIVLNWSEDGRLRPKHVANYNLIVITPSCLDVYCVLTVHNMLYKFYNCSYQMWYQCTSVCEKALHSYRFSNFTHLLLSSTHIH